MRNLAFIFVWLSLVVACAAANQAPIADGGADRYAGNEPLVLDGRRSFDPDSSGIAGYSWRQVSGPEAVITDANTARPSISFPRSHYVQRCRFELVVSDGELDSEPDSVDVTVVPAWGPEIERLYQLNPPFDPNKPTFVAFGGGYGCDYGGASGSSDNWDDKANVITFDEYYSYYSNHYGDKLIVYLSEVAPDYREPIQTIGFSAGNKPAIKIARYMNRTYSDGRYAVNRVTFLDEASRYCNNEIPGDVSVFLANPVEDEQCWVDTYIAETGQYNSEVLNVRFPPYHGIPPSWYRRSLDADSWIGGDIYNGGITAGEFISVIGPGKNLHLAVEHLGQYYFEWSGKGPNDVWDDEPDTLLFYNEPCFPGRLPEPVVLVGPGDGSFVDSNGTILSCEESENA
ncbi:MAG: PKD domain-containing protein, partial [Planctomycetota bacterium]